MSAPERPWGTDPDRQWDERHDREEARRERVQYEDPEPDRKDDDQ